MAESHKIDDPQQMKVTPGAPLHPGGWILRNVLKPFGLTVTAAAEKIGVRRATLSDVVNGKAALSRDLAYRLEALTGVEAKLMIDLQTAYDDAQAAETRARYRRENPRLEPAAAAA